MTERLTVVRVVCDRCGRAVTGIESTEMTSGFYRVGSDSPWHGYANPGETVLCDGCVWVDPRYLADHPYQYVVIDDNET